MLVLSRRSHQDIVFPNLGITLHVLQVRGQIVKIGIDAPKNIPVIRREAMTSEASVSSSQVNDKEFDHRLRNELNLLHLRLETIQRRLDLGEKVDAESTLRALLNSVDAFDRQLSSVSNRSTMRLLVVEDCDNERKLMAYMLALHGFEVHVARDGSEALEWLRASHFLPDVVLMDVQMPVSNGLDALHQIRDDRRLNGLLVFAVTGSKRAPDEEPVGRGWDGWFSKPLDVQHLIRSIQEVLPKTYPLPAVVGG